MRPRRVNPPRLLPRKVRTAGFLPYLDPALVKLAERIKADQTQGGV